MNTGSVVNSCWGTVTSQGQPFDRFLEMYLDAQRMMFLFCKTILKFNIYVLVYDLRLVVSQH